VPVNLPSGTLYGTLCCLSHEADPSLGERDVRFLEVIAAIVGESLGERQAELERRRRIAGDIGRVLSDSALSIHFQPIVSLRDRRLAGVEALARFTCAPYRSPHHWFADAWEVGLGAELELMASSMALAALDSVPDGAYLSINVSPTVVSDPRFEAQLRACPAERVVIEVTEHAVAQHSGDLRSAMTRLRRLGLRFAVDDLGAGYAGLSQALVLAPEIIKLDRFLISGIDGDLARQALSAAVVAFAGQMGTRVIAEGVETAAEARVLLEIGIRYAQGFHLGRPAAVPHPPAA
jgi:EAL domain-containing protein (putative c-di-GMP-specific phosphodiesterase class I)